MSIVACSVEGCETKVRCKGLCNKHYIRQRNHGDPTVRLTPEGRRPCTAPGCDKFRATNGLCSTHAKRLRVSGTIAAPSPRPKRYCQVEGCDRPHYGRSKCQRHYLRERSGLPIHLPRDIINGMRICTRCLNSYPEESFGTSVRLAGGKNIYCSSCLSDLGHIRRANKRANEYEAVNRNIVLERDGWTCHLCKEPIPADLKWPHPLSASMDHVIPLAKGGSHTYQNVQSAHLSCNISKGARIPA